MSRQFAYKAVDQSGVVQSDILEAATVHVALEQLARMQMVPLQVTERSKGRTSWFTLRFRHSSRLSARDIVILTQALASLLAAGLMLDRALGLLSSTSERKGVRHFCRDLERRVRAGEPFSSALKNYSKYLPSYYIPMVAAGELSGSLASGLSRLGQYLEKSAAIRERLIGAITYPAILLAMILSTFILVLTVVLPKFRTLFAESQAQLPWATQGVLALGDLVTDYGWAVVVSMALFAIQIARMRRSPVQIMRWSSYILRSRLAFGLVARPDTSRFFRAIATLIHGGVPVPAATGVAAELLSNLALRQAASRVHGALKEGGNLSHALESEGVFPHVAIQLARVGEETGRLEELLLEAADILDREVQQTIDRLLSVLVPTVTIVMGALVAALVGSVLVGILSLNDLAL